MNPGVIYLLTGAAHAARLVVSLMSLRRFYQGPVTVFSTRSESHEIGRQCAADPRLGVEHREWAQVVARRNSTFLTKVALVQSPPFDPTVYLDCDTLVTGSIEPLLAVTAHEEFVTTQFARWVTTGRIMQRRIKRWQKIEATGFDLPSLVASALSLSRPAINNGVISTRPEAAILRPWWELAWAGRHTFICDEIALQLLLHHFPHRLLDCRFNNSPRYGVSDQVRIWHFHGDKHASRAWGARIWLPEYHRAVAENYANLASWGPGPDESLQRLLSATSS